MAIDISTFTFDERDEFNRKAIASKVITLLNSDVDVSPMVIDGGWGTGKSEFCHKLMNMMKVAESHHLIYVDAFQADHADEPLLTILSELLKVLPEGEERNSFTKKAIPAVRYGLKTLVKAGVGHLLRQDAADVVNDFDKEIQKAADKAIDSSVESLLKDHVKANESINSLQKALQDIAANKKIVLFVDELDRCRPNFSANMLEIIKHTFDVEGVQFVLITNTSQLKASINHCYGEAVDAQRYLDKFLKFTFSLPNQVKTNSYTNTNASIIHYQNLLRKSSITQDTWLDRDSALSLVSHLINISNISLREVETLVRHIQVYQMLSNNEGFKSNTIIGYKLLRLIGVILFCFKPKLAAEMVDRKSDAKELGKFLGGEQIVKFEGEHPYPEHYQVILVMLGQECFYSSKLFSPTEGENHDSWEGLISQYFKQSGYPPGKGERSKIVTDTIETLRLGAFY